MGVLSREQIAAFWRDGYLMVDDAVTPAQLVRLKAEISAWVEASRAHSAPFGPPTVDGRPRFDMGTEHTAAKPALRRINNPSDISDAYLAAMRDSRMTDMVADLIGPDVKFHHCKINLKLTGAKTEVLYHQDFAYTPHTNDDIVTALLFLDDIDETNGALTVVPGSHKGEMHSLFEGERFTGAVAPLGTALTEGQLAELWKLADEPYLCFDGDNAGRRAAQRAAERGPARLANPSRTAPPACRLKRPARKAAARPSAHRRVKATTVPPIARLIRCRAGRRIGAPDMLPLSFAKAISEPVKVIEPITMSRTVATFTCADGTVFAAARFR